MTDQPTDPNEGIQIPKKVEEEIEKKRQHAILVEQIKKELKTNPRYKEFFDQYNPYSVDSFITQYAWKKAHYIEHGKDYIGYQEDDMLRFENEGAEELVNIQWKKFFNIECLWRAEKIKVPEVEHTYDFIYWSEDLSHCPFLPPLTEDEVELYIEYVLGDRYEEEMETDWDNLRRAMEADPGDDDDYDDMYPEWFTVFDMRYGTEGLIKLPDIRGEKEDFYLDLYYEDKRKREPKEEKSESPPNTLQMLEYYRLEAIEAFIKEFEDEKLLRYFHLVEELNEPYGDWDLNVAVDRLREAGEPVPIEAANNWRDAVVKAWDDYHRRKLAEGIRAAYRDYCMRLENKVTVQDEAEDMADWEEFRKTHKDELVKGRVLNGEPPDLNF